MTQQNHHVSEAFARYPIPLFIMFGGNVCTKSTGNDKFLEFFPPLAALQASVDDLTVKSQAAMGRDHEAIVARDLSHQVSLGLFRQGAAYVQAHCENNLEILLSSGYLSTKSPAPFGPLNAPANPRLRRTGLDGQIEYRFSRVPGVTGGYTIEVGEEPEGPFTMFAQVPQTKVIIDGRTPMKTYWVRSRAIGTAGPSPWSTVISIVAM
jgi:hypothetical protein